MRPKVNNLSLRVKSAYTQGPETLRSPGPGSCDSCAIGPSRFAGKPGQTFGSAGHDIVGRRVVVATNGAALRNRNPTFSEPAKRPARLCPGHTWPGVAQGAADRRRARNSITAATRAGRSPPGGVTKFSAIGGVDHSVITASSRPAARSSHTRNSDCTAKPTPASRAGRSASPLLARSGRRDVTNCDMTSASTASAPASRRVAPVAAARRFRLGQGGGRCGSAGRSRSAPPVGRRLWPPLPWTGRVQCRRGRRSRSPPP